MPDDFDSRKGAAYQMGRRRFTAVPGYASVLPRVFPFRIRTSEEHADLCIQAMLYNEYTGFALTSHPSSMDGHVHLWVSNEMAEFLNRMDMVPSGSMEATG